MSKYWNVYKPKLNTQDLRSPIRHCIQNYHLAIANMPTSGLLWQMFIKHCNADYVHKCGWNFTIQMWDQLLWALRHLGWPIIQCKHVRCSDKSVFLTIFGRNGCRVLWAKDERTIQTVFSNKFKCQGLSWVCHSMGQRSFTRFWCSINAEKYT